MREYLTIGSSPYDEPCAQVGSADYRERMRLETRALINQMERIHPVPKDDDPVYANASFTPYYATKSFPHDFGSYHEVCAIYDDEHEASCKWAYQAEDLCPSEWDTEARKELTNNGYEFEPK